MVLRKWLALMSPLTVSFKSMMWIWLRFPARKGFIFGFHRLVRWPKCTPASISSWTVTIGKGTPLDPARASASGEACAAGTEPAEPSRRAHPAIRGWETAEARRGPQGGPRKCSLPPLVLVPEPLPVPDREPPLHLGAGRVPGV